MPETQGDLPADTGDHRPVTQRHVRKCMYLIGKELGEQLGTSDSIPARLSNGEFVVRAAAVQKHRALLEAINRGMLPAFARGGLVATNEAGAPESFYPS